MIKKNKKFSKFIQKLNLFVIQKLDNNYFITISAKISQNSAFILKLYVNFIIKKY